MDRLDDICARDAATGRAPGAYRGGSGAAWREEELREPLPEPPPDVPEPGAARGPAGLALDRSRSVAPPSIAFEFRDVMDRTFALMSEDPDMGPKLREATSPALRVRRPRPRGQHPGRGGGEEGNLHWEWNDDVAWEPKVRMTMTSEIANKYFQGKENVPIAIARRRIKAGGGREIGPETHSHHEARLRALPGHGGRRDFPHLALWFAPGQPALTGPLRAGTDTRTRVAQQAGK